MQLSSPMQFDNKINGVPSDGRSKASNEVTILRESRKTDKRLRVKRFK